MNLTKQLNQATERLAQVLIPSTNKFVQAKIPGFLKPSRDDLTPRMEKVC